MTSMDSPVPTASQIDHKAVPKRSFLDSFEAKLNRASESLNPILVKEARQALKSKQFVITYTLLLLCGWCWSLLGVAIWSPAIYFSGGGSYMLFGYCLILNVAMILIVPFTAFRSLAAESEHGTFELMSITTLSARQIVTGKLGSAILQMLVYYSALTPCVAFTYMLRGVDVVTIFLILFYTFLISVLASAVALFLATLTRSQTWQVLVSVIVLIALVALTIFWCVMVSALTFENGAAPLDEPMFWIGNLAMLTAHISYMILFVFAAAAQISFASDNRSTKLRIILLGQQVLLLAWMAYFWFATPVSDIPAVFITLSAIHWAMAGALIIGEKPELSPRVKRQLPQSFVERLLFTWFNPGAGTGYVFVVGNLLAAGLVTIGCVVLDELFRGGTNTRLETIPVAIFMFCYVVAYVGVARLVVMLMSRFFYFGLALPLLITVVLAVGGALLPMGLQIWIMGFTEADEYTTLQATNWLFTIVQSFDTGFDDVGWSMLIVVPFSALVLLINCLLATVEVEQVRQTAPRRVLADDEELHPRKGEKKKSSPWDDDPADSPTIGTGPESAG